MLDPGSPGGRTLFLGFTQQRSESVPTLEVKVEHDEDAQHRTMLSMKGEGGDAV